MYAIRSYYGDAQFALAQALAQQGLLQAVAGRAHRLAGGGQVGEQAGQLVQNRLEAAELV